MAKPLIMALDQGTTSTRAISTLPALPFMLHYSLPLPPGAC